MPKPMAELSRAWLRKAFGDLDTARQIGGLPDGHLDAGICHCRQAVEKTLKGFLAPYSAACRYPDEPGIPEPSRGEFDEALQHAPAICDFAPDALPADARP